MKKNLKESPRGGAKNTTAVQGKRNDISIPSDLPKRIDLDDKEKLKMMENFGFAATTTPNTQQQVTTATTTNNSNNNKNNNDKLEQKEEEKINKELQQQTKNEKKTNNVNDENLMKKKNNEMKEGEENENPWSVVGSHNFNGHISPQVADPYVMNEREASPELKISYALKATEKIKDSNSKVHPILQHHMTKKKKDVRKRYKYDKKPKQKRKSKGRGRVNQQHHTQHMIQPQHQQHLIPPQEQQQHQGQHQQQQKHKKVKPYAEVAGARPAGAHEKNGGVIMPGDVHSFEHQYAKNKRNKQRQHSNQQVQQRRQLPPQFPQGHVVTQNPTMPSHPYHGNYPIPYLQKTASSSSSLQQHGVQIPVTGPPHHVNPLQYNRNKQYQHPQKQLYAQRQAEAMAKANGPIRPFEMILPPPNEQLSRKESVNSINTVRPIHLQNFDVHSIQSSSLPNGMAPIPKLLPTVSLQRTSSIASSIRDTSTDEIRAKWNIGTFIQVWSYTRAEWILAQIFDITGPAGGILEVRYCDKEHSNGYKKVRRYAVDETRPVPDEIEIPPTENRDVIQVGSIVRVYSLEIRGWIKAHVIKCEHNGKIHPNGEELIIRYIEGLLTGQMREIGRYGPFVQRIGERKNPPMTNVVRKRETDWNNNEKSKLNPMNPHTRVHHKPKTSLRDSDDSGKMCIKTPSPDETSRLTTWIILTKSELLNVFGDDEICDRILSYGVSMPVIMNANEHPVSDIIMAAKRLSAVEFPGIKFTIKDANFTFIQSFFTLLQKYPEISTLQLFGTKNSQQQQQQRSMPYPILLNENITSLHLSDLQFTDDAFKSLIFQINGMQNLKTLSLSGMNINLKKGKLLGFMLMKNKSLTCLNLGHNDINDACAHDIIRGIKTNTTLEELGFQNNNLVSISTWGEFLENNKTLRVLNLASNNITNTFFIPSGLKSLVLSSNALDYNNLGRLLESLIFSPNELKSLNLSNNPIHELLRFDDVLKKNPQLEELYCENIGIYDNNLNVLLEALKSCNLKNVSFKSNHLTDHGMYKLHCVVRKCPNVKSLDLRFNCVDFERQAVEVGDFVTLC